MDDEQRLSVKLYDAVTAKIREAAEAPEDIDELFLKAKLRAMELYPDHTFVDCMNVGVLKYIGITGWKTMEEILEEDHGRWNDALKRFLWHDEYGDIMDYFAIPNDVYDRAKERRTIEASSALLDLSKTIQEGRAHVHRDGIYHYNNEPGVHCDLDVPLSPPPSAFSDAGEWIMVPKTRNE